MTLVDLSQMAMRLFTVIGFLFFLMGFVLVYVLGMACLIAALAQTSFRYDVRANHPNRYRSCLFYTESGEYKSTERSWVCHRKPKFQYHWSHWIIGG